QRLRGRHPTACSLGHGPASTRTPRARPNGPVQQRGRLQGPSYLEKPSCRPRLLQRLDTVHGLAGMGESLSQMWYKGSRGSHLTSQHSEGSGPTQPSQPMTMMRFYDTQHGFYAGVDLHARRLHLCVLDSKGQVVKDANIAATPDSFLQAIAPYRSDLVVGC